MFSVSRATRVLLYLMSVLSLGCSSAPSTFYVLMPEQEATQIQSARIKVVIGPIEFPAYLERPHIVTRSSGTELRLAEYHRWGESVHEGFLRVVAVDVGNILSSADVFVFPANRGWKPDHRVVGRATRFDADDSGEAVLEIGWVIENRDEGLLHGPIRSRYSVQSSSAGDYAAITRALSQTASLFSRDIAEALVELQR